MRMCLNWADFPKNVLFKSYAVIRLPRRVLVGHILVWEWVHTLGYGIWGSWSTISRNLIRKLSASNVGMFLIQSPHWRHCVALFTWLMTNEVEIYPVWLCVVSASYLVYHHTAWILFAYWAMSCDSALIHAGNTPMVKHFSAIHWNSFSMVLGQHWDRPSRLVIEKTHD